ncbi:MAG: hypothetical protein KBT88_04225 [Gammaproteobacteria bacterium]|nr:hypothetical protein [Gammaproteobacteria bacterium]MBQ0838970.1 hypothetical protein [Gammaproteobacteria bacterium]
MSIFKKPAFIAALFSVVIFGLSACGGDDSDAGNAEELRGAVKNVASKAKSTAETAVDRVEDKIKEPTTGTDDE